MTTSNHADYAVCSSAELPEGARRIVRCGTLTVGVFRVHGQLRGWENKCVHQGGPVCQGKIIPRVEEVLTADRQATGYRYSETQTHIVCPWHGYEYDLLSGEHPGDPAVRLNPVEVREENGSIFVRAPRGER